ncbi:MAG TPA: Ig-like domain-containing protein, partial [Planctomycetota bacterium]|nr:Ig-like domain-containing protein [Planctomycetota bacterium]
VPNSVSSNCRIRIGPSVGSTSADESDTVFSIQSAPARVTALSFIPGSTFTQAPASLAISFSLALQGASVNSNTVTVTRAGTDGQTGTGDDQTVALQNLSLNGTSLSIVLPGSLPNDTYTLRLPDGGLKDINGAFVDGEFSGSLPSGNRIPGGAFSASFVLNVQSPVAQAASFNLSEDTPLAGTVSATDANGDVLTYEIVSQPAKGTLVFNTATGAFTYNPDVNQNGNDTFTFRASDGVNVSNTATVTLLIAPVNDVPSAVDLQFTLDEDVPLRGNLQGTDIDSAALTYILQSTPAHGVLEVLENGAFVYRPHTEYSGPDTFTYKVSDGTASSSLARVLLQVNSVNDVPVARRQDLATLEDTPVSGTLKAVDNDGQPLTYRFIASGSLGVALITDAGTGAFTYTPNPNVSGVDVISFVASDGIEDSSSTNIIIAISPVNDAPRAVLSADSTIGVAVGQSVTLDGSGSSDIEGELSFAWDFGDGTVVAAAPALVQHAWSAAGVYTVHLTVTDAEGIKDSVSINVVVSALGGGSSPDRPDSDGDGFSDELEIALNTDPLSASSSPIQNKPLSSVRPLELSKPRITLHLSADGKDSISLKGKLPVRHRMNLAGQKVVVDIGGVIETFVLDARGRSQKSADKSLRLSAKSKYGVVFAQMAPFTLTLRKGTFSDRLSAELHAGEDQKKTPRSLSATVLFDGAYFQTTLQLLVTGNDSMLSAK